MTLSQVVTKAPRFSLKSVCWPGQSRFADWVAYFEYDFTRWQAEIPCMDGVGAGWFSCTKRGIFVLVLSWVFLTHFLLWLKKKALHIYGSCWCYRFAPASDAIGWTTCQWQVMRILFGLVLTWTNYYFAASCILAGNYCWQNDRCGAVPVSIRPDLVAKIFWCNNIVVSRRCSGL
jgi:hypothetical protein